MKKSKRRLTKTLSAGAGLVAVSHAMTGGWIRPVISTAVIPSHAATSCVPINFRAAVEQDTGNFSPQGMELQFTLPDSEIGGSFNAEFNTEHPLGLTAGSGVGEIENGLASLDNEYNVDFSESSEIAGSELNVRIDVEAEGGDGPVDFTCFAETTVVAEGSTGQLETSFA